MRPGDLAFDVTHQIVRRIKAGAAETQHHDDRVVRRTLPKFQPRRGHRHIEMESADVGHRPQIGFALIEHCLPAQRGNVSMSNLQVVNAILYVAEHGCKWRGLPKRFGNWHTVYTRMNRWAKAGVLDRMFAQLQKSQIVRIKIETVALDSTRIKVHPDGTGALKKTAHKRLASPAVDGTPRFIWLPQMLEQPSRSD
ncbi:transposase [Xanthomonas oryzae pv. oryzicola BLS256]|uniref:Transposase n=1 Tax=Xanthomonas oryzae pv. oryzicola (strain BLS256) TaxID=383407 RepID=G7TC56_XANOB|nr:transposase [Xanthomonas oryzae pv. oryzicola BLS256]